MKDHFIIRRACPACSGSSIRYSQFAIFAPWVRELTGVTRVLTKFNICELCSSGWVTESYSPKVMARLYSDYRGDTYYSVRNSWEPTYSNLFNTSIDGGERALAFRRASMEKHLNNVVPSFSLSAQVLVDIGGGHGGLIPNWPNLKRKIVLDISGVGTEGDIERIASWDELGNVLPDFVMACGLLEHLSSPLEFLEDLRNVIKSLGTSQSWKKTIFYFEVPKGVPSKRAGWPLYIFASASLFKNCWKYLDIKSSKWGRSKVPLRIAEHIQFFTDFGLNSLLRNAGFEVLSVQEYPANSQMDDNKSIRFDEAWAVIAKIATN